MRHELKTWPGPFQAGWVGDKPWEFRKNDRDFKERDEIVLQEWDQMIPDNYSAYTGREREGFIRLLLKGPDFEIPADYCIFTFEETMRRDA